MIHPREKFREACNKLGREPIQDYFEYADFETGTSSGVISKLYKTLDNRGDKYQKKAYQIFLDTRKRILIEGLMLGKGISATAELTGINEEILSSYTELFFNLDSFNDLPDKLIFISCISRTDVRRWFTDALNSSLSVLRQSVRNYATTAQSDPEALLKTIQEETLSDFCILRQQAMELIMTGQFDKRSKELYSLGLQAAGVSLKASGLISQFFQKEQKEEFISSWNLEVISDDPDSFEQPGSPETEAELLKLMQQVNPIKTMDESNPLNEEDLMADDL